VVIWRTVLWHPDLVTNAFSVATPYQPPSAKYTSLEELVKAQPQFFYQLPIAAGDLERMTKTKPEIRTFLNGLYGKQMNGNVRRVCYHRL
jgi:soluble epoxide hydrolase/lipid-phosphate phosphatase